MILTYGNININGLHSSISNESPFIKLIKSTNFDLYFIQETRIILSDDIFNLFQSLGYFIVIHEGEEIGRNGIGVLVKLKYKDDFVTYIFNYPRCIRGRVMVLELFGTYFFNVYLPFSGIGCNKWKDKLSILQKLGQEINILLSKYKNVFVCGDFNLVAKDPIKYKTDYTGFYNNQLTHRVNIKLNVTPVLYKFFEPMIQDNTLICGKDSSWKVQSNDNCLHLQQDMEESNILNVMNDCNTICHIASIYDKIPDFQFDIQKITMEREYGKMTYHSSSYIQSSILKSFEQLIPKIPISNDTNTTKRIDHIFSNCDVIAMVETNTKISDHDFIFGTVRCS